MSYYSSGQGYSHPEGNGYAPPPPSATQARDSRLQPNAGGQVEQLHNSQAGPNPSAMPHSQQSRATPHLARTPLHERSHSEQMYAPAMRPQLHNYPTTPALHSSNTSDAGNSPQSYQGNVHPGAYNPQAYADINNSSPTRAGSTYTSASQALPGISYAANSSRRYDSSGFQPSNRLSGTVEGIHGNRQLFSTLSQQYSPHLADQLYGRTSSNNSPQQSRFSYSPQLGADHQTYNNYETASPIMGTAQASYSNSPLLSARGSVRNTPLTQSSTYALNPRQSSDLGSLRSQTYNDPGQPSFLPHASQQTSAYQDQYSQYSSQYAQSQAGATTDEHTYNLRRAPTTRHPQSRPLPGPPSHEPNDRYTHYDTHDNELYDAEGTAQQDLYEQVENTLRASFGNSAQTRPSQQDYRGQFAHNDTNYNALLSPSVRSSGGSPSTGREGFHSLTGSIRSPRINDYHEDSDAEAEAGLAAMQIAAQEEYEAIGRHRSHDSPDGTHTSARVHGTRTPDSSSSRHSDGEDYGTIDMTSIGGGFDVQLSYGGEPSQLAAGSFNIFRPGASSSWGEDIYVDPDGTQLRRESVRRSTESPSRGGSGVTGYSAHAEIDVSGTGGFTEPTGETRRLSFDEGDDMYYYDEQTEPGQNMASGIPDLPYTPTSLASRPLPPPPPNENDQSHDPSARWQAAPWVSTQAYGYPVTPESYSNLTANSSATNLIPPRSISLTSPSVSPQLTIPRANTDAEQRMRRGKRATSYGMESIMSESNPMSPGLDLPTLPVGKRFQPGRLTQREFDMCRAPWSMSGVTGWLRSVTAGESELREQPLAEALLMLFVNKVPNIQLAEAESLAAYVVQSLVNAGILGREEEWLKFNDGTLTGVLPQLTGSGCYALSLHDFEFSGRCYATTCQRTVKRIDLQHEGAAQAKDWATFYNITKAQVESADRKEVERQNIIHEIVTTEQQYLDDLILLKTFYRDGLSKANPPIIAPRRVSDFLKQVFGKLDAVQSANNESLLPQLRYRQKEQGPWILVISDIFRNWIRKAKAAYIEYAANFPQAYFAMKMEEQKNGMFIAFCEQQRNNKQTRRLGWDSFLKAPITRLQQYGLLLSTVLKKMPNKPEPEYTNLQTAMDEIRTVTLECDAQVHFHGRKVDLIDIQTKLVLRPEMKNVELNITQRGRELLFQGDLQRLGNAKFRWLDTRAILLDNFLILAKITADPGGGPKAVRYDVSKLPIPMDLLSLESSDDDAVVKSSVKGISSTGGKVSAPAPSLVHRNTDLSLALIESTASSKTMIASTTLERTEDKGEKMLYPFRIKHLGKDSFTLFASRLEDRKNWCDKIIEAKAKHASSLFRQGAEPFSLRVLADTAFAYDGLTTGMPRRAPIKGTPLCRALEEVEAKYANAQRPGPICRAKVNCATTFTQQGGKQMITVGTDYGVYTAEVGDCRNWTRAITTHRVTQLAVLEEYNLFLLISDKSLIAYHLDNVCPPSYPPNSSSSTNNSMKQKPPQKLSGNKDVGFFAHGRMKDRTLVFYKKRDGLQSTFRILEPILQKSTERRSRLLHRGTTDFFRDYDEFYIPTECTGLELFASTLAVATAKGFEVLNLDKKTPFTVPDLKATGVATIAARLGGVDPLAMFRLNEGEFICVYEECAIYVNKYGDVSRSVVMEFVGRAKAAALEGGFLVLFDRDFVEVRDAQLGRLKQVVPGVEVRCLDNGRGGNNLAGGLGAPVPFAGNGVVNGTTVGAFGNNVGAAGVGGGAANAGVGSGRTIKFAMQHPEQEKCQIVMELVLGGGQGVR